MKLFYRVTLMMLLVPFLQASEGEKQLKRSTALLTANLILTEFEADFSEAPVNADFMAHQMTSKPEDYIKRDAARAKLQEFFQERIRTEYRQKVDLLLARIAEKNGVADAFDASFQKKVGTIPDTTFNKVQEKHFVKAFEEQRKKVCDAQMVHVTRELFPTEEEVDGSPEEALIKKLTQRLAEAQKFQVFEENHTYLRDLVVLPAVQDAYRQRSMQSQFLESARSPQAVTPDDFAIFLEKTLLAALPEFKSDKYPRVYTIFPSVKKSIPLLAEKKAKTRYAEFLQASTQPFSEEDVKKMILADVQGHQARAASRNKIRDLFLKQSLDMAPKRYVEHVAENRRSDVEQYLKTTPIPKKELSALFEGIFDQKQQPSWEAARTSIIAQQLVSIYPELQARTWTPTDAAVESYTGQEATDEGRTLRKELLTGVASSSQRDRDALEETRAQAGTLLDQELARGSQALRQQRRLVMACSNDIVAEASARLAKTKPEKLAVELFKLFQPRIQAQWPDHREREIYAPLNPKPGNAESAYLTLFPSVDELLRQLIREIIQKLAEPEPIPPKDPPPDAPPPEKKIEPLKLTCAFTIDMQDNQIIVKSSGDIVLENATLPFTYEEYRKQESKTLTRIANQFAESLEKRAKGQNVELSLDITVKNGMIYYQLVSRLRDRLDYRLKKLRDNEKFNIKLTDKME
jgi:hypothetical protein